MHYAAAYPESLGGEDGGIWGQIPSGVQKHSPLWGIRGQKLNTSAHLTVNFDCNFAHKCSEYAENQLTIPRCNF